MTTDQQRLPTRQLIQPDVPKFDRRTLKPEARDALTGLLLTMADDEFVLGFWDSEWTGIAPLLEEDVAFSSLAQDEIGHARIWFEMLAQLTGDGADRLAFHRNPEAFTHARLLDHPRTDWAFSIARRWLYDTADSVRLAALSDASFQPLAEVVAKVRREERYHLMHVDAWLRRLAVGQGEGRAKLDDALRRLGPEASSVFAPLPGEEELVRDGVIAASLADLYGTWTGVVGPVMRELRLPFDPIPPTTGGRGPDHGPDFAWLWTEFTSVARSEQGARW